MPVSNIELKYTINQPFNDQCSHHIEISQLICSANQMTDFYMMGTLLVTSLRFQNTTH